MPNYADELKTLLDNVSNWTITDPAHANVFFPWKVSRDYLQHPARVGKRFMCWVQFLRDTPDLRQGGGLVRMNGIYGIYCYTRVRSSNENEVKAAQTSVENMKDQVGDIVKANWQRPFSGKALWMEPDGAFPLDDTTVTPAIFLRIMQVRIGFEE